MGRLSPALAVVSGLLLLLALVLPFMPTASASLIASANIAYCDNNGVDPVNCTRKMVVTLTVDAGQLAGAEQLVTVSTASDNTNGGTVAQFEPIRITASRSLVRYRYPIFYVQAYNAKPHELVISGSFLRQCNADFDANTATCGLTYNADGTAIPLSQGFCCDCGVCSTLGLCADGARAKGACDVLNAYTQASCMRFGTHWYSGYSIGSSSTYYTINITMTRNTTARALPSTAEERATLFLSPDSVGDASEGFGVSARLIGDFNPTEQPLVLTQSMLFVPSLPREDARVTAGPSEWMILDKSLVTLDGRACDKVGVSFEAFASQGNACRLTPGSCLNSQLEDLRAADKQTIAAGKKGRYMAQSLGDFDVERYTDTPNANHTFDLSTAATNDPYISYLASAPAATMITLTIAADDLQYVVSVAPGKILSMAMNVPVLDASTRDGAVRVEVQNTGAIVSRFTVSVSCGAGVFPIAAQVVSLDALQRRNLTFAVLVQQTSAEGQATCTATLRDSKESVQDTHEVEFTVRGVDWNNGTQGGSNNPDGGTADQGESQSACSRCGLLNVRCVFANVCVGLLVGELLIAVGVAVVLFVVCKVLRPLSECVGALGACCCGGTAGAAKRRKKEEGAPGAAGKHGPATYTIPPPPEDERGSCLPSHSPRYRRGSRRGSAAVGSGNALAALWLLQLQQQQQQQQQLLLRGQEAPQPAPPPVPVPLIGYYNTLQPRSPRSAKSRARDDPHAPF